MRSKYAWILLPPALALLLVFGPLQSMGGSTTKRTNGNESRKPAAVADTTKPGSALPELPNLWQVGSAILGVLLLGTTVVLWIRHGKNRQGASVINTDAVTVRQTLRVGPKQRVHVLEFDDRLLLIGATEQQLTLLGSQERDAAIDEAQILDRLDDDDDGAVPRDMILPRPQRRGVTAPKPARPSTPKRRPTPISAATSATATSARLEARQALSNFRSLLEKAQAKASR